MRPSVPVASLLVVSLVGFVPLQSRADATSEDSGEVALEFEHVLEQDMEIVVSKDLQLVKIEDLASKFVFFAEGERIKSTGALSRRLNANSSVCYLEVRQASRHHSAGKVPKGTVLRFAYIKSVADRSLLADFAMFASRSGVAPEELQCMNVPVQSLFIGAREQVGASLTFRHPQFKDVLAAINVEFDRKLEEQYPGVFKRKSQTSIVPVSARRDMPGR